MIFMWDRIIATCIGSFLGFFFGLIIYHITHRHLKNDKRELSRKMLIFLIQQLKDKLNLAPNMFEYISIDVLMGYLDVIMDEEHLLSDFQRFLVYYTHWKVGSYESGRLRYLDVERDKANLDELINNINKRSTFYVCECPDSHRNAAL